jgi:hypothetical protein
MSKKLKLLLLGITIVIAGFFIIVLFSGEEEHYKAPLFVSSDRLSEDPENYEFEEKGDVTLVTNDNLGFSFEVPKDWEHEKYYDSYGIDPEDERENKGLIFFSPDYLIDENKRSAIPLAKGCSFNIFVFQECYEDKDGVEFCISDDLKEEIEMIINEEIATDNEKVVEVDNHNGHKIRYIQEKSGVENTRIPIENKIYEIIGYFSGEDIEECQQHYESLLNSISFTKNED